MLRKTRVAGALVAALALAAAAACSDDANSGGDDPAADGGAAESEAPRLEDLVNESNRLLYELESAENRIIQACLEDHGFTVHDQLTISVTEPEPEDDLLGAENAGNWPPPLDEATKYGLGWWAHEDEADPDEVEEYEAFKGYDFESDLGAGVTEGGGAPDNSEFDELDPQEQYDWWVAYWGEAAALDENGYLIGEEGAAASDEDEIYTGDEFSYVQPEPGGCQREMIDALYDDLRLVEDPEGGKSRGAYWHYRPQNPVDDFANGEASKTMYHEAMAEADVALVDCLAEHGHPGWEFDEEHSLPTFDYMLELYDGEAADHNHPDLPADAPTDYEGKKAFEIAFAVELAECGDETGYREIQKQAWVESQEAFYSSIETEIFAWQEEVTAILTKAQEVLEG
jgi:hypothetical protein